jgi:hypothetical protein
VTAWRHSPVIAGCAPAPDPPPRVLAPEPPKLGILVVPASAGVHGVSLQPRGRPRGCRRGWVRAWMVRAAMPALPSPCNLPGRLPAFQCSRSQACRAAHLVIPPARICGTAHGGQARQRTSCPAEASRARR